jgi:tRNA A-37 threonylcarbamoyl transferase component Bud32
MTLVMKKIFQLHSQNIVHGDLRFANIVFSDPESIQKHGSVQSTIIDFDYSGIEGEKRYPERFNVDITDGFRHPDAQPMELLRCAHDLAAIQWMMRQYQPKDEQLKSVWSSCLESLIDNDEVSAIIADLDNDSLAELELVAKTGDVAMESKATGSPQAK